MIKNKINNKTYIGQTTTSLTNRIRAHRASSKKYKNGKYLCSSHLYEAANKYGWDNFEFSVLSKANSQDILDKLEILWITIYDSNNNEFGYNIENGGHGAGKMSTATKAKLSQKHTGKKLSEETKNKISEALKGKNNPNFGIIFSEERRQKISQSEKGKIVSDATKQKCRDATIKYFSDPEKRKQLSEKQKGKHNSIKTEFKKGNVISEHTRQMVSRTHSGENSSTAKLTWEIVNNIRQEYKNKTISPKEIAKKYNITQSNVYKLLANKTWKIICDKLP